MAYFVVYDESTGEAVSMATVVPDPLPAGLASVDVGEPIRAGRHWDPATLSVVADYTEREETDASGRVARVRREGSDPAGPVIDEEPLTAIAQPRIVRQVDRWMDAANILATAELVRQVEQRLIDTADPRAISQTALDNGFNQVLDALLAEHRQRFGAIGS